MVRALILASLLVTTQARADLPERDTALRVHLANAAERDRGRNWRLPLRIVVGCGFLALGSLLPQDFGALALPAGAMTLTRSTLALLTDDARSFPQAYEALSALPERVRYGERRIERLAHQDRRNRITDGVLTLVLSAAAIPIGFGFARLDDPGYRFGDSLLDYLWVAFAVGGSVNGVLTLSIETPAEAAWASYQRLSPTQLRYATKF